MRFLFRRRIATTVAVLTIALALGASTAVFSVLRTFLFGSIGVPDADRLVVVGPVRELPGRGAVLFADAYPNYEVIRDVVGAFESVAVTVQGTVSWDVAGEARPLQFARVSAGFFTTMGVPPVRGRVFAPSEEGPSPAPLVIISNALWESAFGADTAVLGKTMVINGTAHAIIAVLPPGFVQPAPTDIWLPFDIPANQRVAVTGGRGLTIFGRLSPGTSRERAAAIASDLTKRTLEARPAENRDFRYELRPLRNVLLNNVGSSVLLVQAGAAILLLLAVVNLASLLIAWGFDRQQEMAVREALGAGKGRVARLLLSQSVVVVFTGAFLGLVLAKLAVPWLRSIDINPQLSYFMQRVELDGTVLLLGVCTALIAGLTAGVLPVWFGRNANLNDSLRSGSRSVTLSPAALRWQQGMVFLQAALSVVVLAAAALVAVSFRNSSRVAPGYDPGNLIVARIQFAPTANHQMRAAFMRRFEDEMREDAAIASFGATSTLPVSDIISGGRFFIERPDPAVSTEPELLHFRRITPGYLEAMHIPLLKGRYFDSRDDSSGHPVVIVSKAFADRAWPREDPIGKRIYRLATPAAEETEVVGMVGNVMDAGNRSPPGEAAYVPWARLSTPRVSVAFSPRGTDVDAVAGFRSALRATDPTLAATGIASLKELSYQADAVPRVQTLLLLTFAIVAVGITALGSYGVMSQLVANREREYALRLIFGAAPSQLGYSVLALLARFAIPGIIAGLVAILSLAGTLRAFVFGVEPRSLAVLSAVTLGMVAVTGVATLPSVVRAMRVDVKRSIGAG